MASVLRLLDPRIVRLWRERGLGDPTPPQEKAIPLILRGENVLIVAPTGSGKTEAAVLPVLSLLLREGGGKGVRLLYVTPLRTLNRDLLSRLEWWATKLDLKVAVRHGDTSQAERRAQALSPPDVLITTPETLQLLLIGARLREGLRELKWVVVDEVHELADDRRGVQLALLLEKLRRVLGRDFTVIGLSATIGNPEEVAKFLTGGRRCRVIYTPVAKRFRVEVVWPEPGEEDFELAEKLFVAPEVAARLRRIWELVEGVRTTLIFTNTRPTAEMLGSRFKMWDEKFPVYVHHGSLSQHERVRIEEMLRRGEVRAVVCTSSMELGIDIGHVDLVIQYNSPRETRRLIQRVGRSGHRLDRVSRGVVVVGSSDDALEALVLVRRLKDEVIEPSSPPRKPLDVLAHEVVGYALTGRYGLDEVYEAARSTVPYSDLTREEFERLVRFLEEIRLVRVVGGAVRPAGRRTFDYFFGVLSMIPEVKQYYVVNVEEDAVVGILDDFFVSEYCEPGARFIMAGRPWEVVSVAGDEVRVKPVDDYASAVPSWVGEEIPVPFEVAQEVGRLRGLAEEAARRGEGLSELASRLAREYGADPRVIARALHSAYKAARRGLPVPSDRRIVVEEAKGLVVVHAHFGTRVNRALGKFLAYMVSRSYGVPAYTSEKPYRIVLRAEGVGAGEVAEILRESTPESFLASLRSAVEQSRALRWRLSQIARRMGVIHPSARLGAGDVEKLVIALKGSLPYEEAVREVLERDLDADRAAEVVGRIASGEIEVVTCRGPTPITEEHLRAVREYLEPMPPEKRDALAMMMFKVKLLSKFVALACAECGYVECVPVARLIEGYSCPYCGSTLLYFAEGGEEEAAKLARRCSGKYGDRECSEFWERAELYDRYGWRSVVAALAGLRGARLAKLLERSYDSIDSFFRALWVEYRSLIRERTRKARGRRASGSGRRA